MPDALNPPPRVRFRKRPPWASQMFLNLALWLVLVLALLGARSLLLATDIQPPPNIDAPHNSKPVPRLAGRVTDNAHVLQANDRARIEKMLEKYERETFHQIAVLTVPNLTGEDIEAFSLRVANAWKLGQKGIDNGILVTVAPNDRRVRVELGLGMEKYISDNEAKAVIDNKMIPHFKTADYAGGVQAGLEELMRLGRRFVVKKQDIQQSKGK
jgi:uncharacterized protein